MELIICYCSIQIPAAYKAHRGRSQQQKLLPLASFKFHATVPSSIDAKCIRNGVHSRCAQIKRVIPRVPANLTAVVVVRILHMQLTKPIQVKTYRKRVI